MAADQVPSGNKFVIRPRKPSLAKNLGEHTKDLGDLEALQGPDEPLWVLSTAADAGQDPKAAWERLQEALGSDIEADPALVDEEGNPLYPTGLINVRFAQAPTDQELERFSSDHDLKVQGRNKFVPSQVTFAPAKPSASFLPDRIKHLQSSPKVKSAWADTVSKYTRR
jgi:hypothetical protein